MSSASAHAPNGRPERKHAARAAYAAPFERVLRIESGMPPSAVVALAIAIHVAIVVGAIGASLFVAIHDYNAMIRAGIAEKLAQTYDIDKEEVPPPPPPKEEPKAEEPPPTKDEPKPEDPPKDTPPAPPAAAQAAAVLTQAPTPDEPVDLTGNTMVVGTSTAFAGGTTQANGTSTTAVRNANAVATGVPGGTGTAPSPGNGTGPDKSRAAGLLGSTDWDCPFPPEADAEQIDSAYVTLQVTVGADGKPSQVTIVQDPGHGFGREARRCAMRKTYNTALDRDGKALGGATKPFRVRFSR